MDNVSFKGLLKFGARVTFFYVMACGVCFNGWSVQRAYSGESVPSVPVGRDVYQDKKHAEKETPVPSAGGTKIPSSGGVDNEDPGPSVPAPVADYRSKILDGCNALKNLTPQDCAKWGSKPHEYPQEPYSSCRAEAMANLKEARAALELAKLYETRGKKTDDEIKKLLAERLKKTTQKGGVEINTNAEAVSLAEKMVSEYRTSAAAYGRCREESMASAWKHNMILAGVLSKEEVIARGKSIATCGPYIKGAINEDPTYEDNLSRHFLNKQKSKSRAKDWKLGVAFNPDEPREYRRDGSDNLEYKLYSLDVNAQCSKGYDRAAKAADGGDKVAGFFRNHWGKLLAGGLIILTILCLTLNLPFGFCKKKPSNTTTTTTTTSDINVTNVTNDTNGTNVNETDGTNVNETNGTNVNDTNGTNVNDTNGTNVNDTNGTNDTNVTETTNGPPNEDEFGQSDSNVDFNIRSLAPGAVRKQGTIKPRSSGPRKVTQ